MWNVKEIRGAGVERDELRVDKNIVLAGDALRRTVPVRAVGCRHMPDAVEITATGPVQGWRLSSRCLRDDTILNINGPGRFGVRGAIRVDGVDRAVRVPSLCVWCHDLRATRAVLFKT